MILSYALHIIRNFIYREHSTLIIQNLVPLKGDLRTLRDHLVQNANSAWVEDGKLRLKTWPPKSDVLGITSPKGEAEKWDTWEGPVITRSRRASERPGV